MIVWRLAHKDYAKLDGIGAKRKGGRWNSPGHAVVYASSHLSLAALELLVHLEVDIEDIPDDYVSIKIDVPDSLPVTTTRAKPDLDDQDSSRTIGDKWVKANKTPCLQVASVVIPQEQNILINPNHDEMVKIKTTKKEKFEFDPRLFG